MSEGNKAITRRHALLAGGAAAAAALALGDTTLAAPVIQSGGGLAGGGSVAVTGGGVANFSVLGSRFAVAGQTDPLILGGFLWSDSNGVELVSTAISNYGPASGDPNARTIEGLTTMNGVGRHPFVLTLFDEGPPEKKADRLQLKVMPALPTASTPETAVGANDQPIYSSDAALATGDLQIVKFDIPA